jgi:hypothetical protein
MDALAKRLDEYVDVGSALRHGGRRLAFFPGPAVQEFRMVSDGAIPLLSATAEGHCEELSPSADPSSGETRSQSARFDC